MNEAIKLAKKGGYSDISGWFDCEGRESDHRVLDPQFWVALGKGLGNKETMECDSPKCDSKLCEYAGYKDPKRMFDSYMETIWYGYDQDKFWKELLNQKQ